MGFHGICGIWYFQSLEKYPIKPQKNPKKSTLFWVEEVNTVHKTVMRPIASMYKWQPSWCKYEVANQNIHFCSYGVFKFKFWWFLICDFCLIKTKYNMILFFIIRYWSFMFILLQVKLAIPRNLGIWELVF